MATELTTIQVQRRTPVQGMVWYDGENAVEVARWLVDQGKAQIDVHFKQGYLALSIGGFSKEVPAGEDGVWLDATGNIRRQQEIDEHFDMVYS